MKLLQLDFHEKFSLEEVDLNIKGTLIQIWKFRNIFVFM